MRDALGISWVTVRKGRKKVRSFCCVHVFPANRSNNGVDPRGLEPLASAMRGRSEGFAAVRYRSKNRLNKPNPRIVPPRMCSMQDPASELLRIPLLGTPVNRPPVDAPDLLGWHHGWCRPVIETRVGNEEEQA